MEALLLLAEVVAFALLVAWLARGRGEAGLFGWRLARPPESRRGQRER